MSRFAPLLMFVVITLVLSACRSDRSVDRAADQASLSPSTSKEGMDGTFESPPPRDTMTSVMLAKLAHAQAVLEGIAMADFAQVESNAMAMKRISQGSDWLAHDTPAYFQFSEEFRGICDDLINHAKAQNASAMVTDYANLTNSCVACHDYLRSERAKKDLPGRVSMLERPES